MVKLACLLFSPSDTAAAQICLARSHPLYWTGAHTAVPESGLNNGVSLVPYPVKHMMLRVVHQPPCMNVGTPVFTTPGTATTPKHNSLSITRVLATCCVAELCMLPFTSQANDPSASSKFQLLQHELNQQLHTQQKQQMQLQEQLQQFNLHHHQQQQQAVLLLHQQQQHATAAFPSAPLPHPFLTLQQQNLLHHSQQHSQQQHQVTHQVTHLHHMMYQQQLLQQQQQQLLLHDQHQAHLQQQQQQKQKGHRSDTHAANQGEVTSPACPPTGTIPHRLSGTSSTDPGASGVPITAAETTTLLLQQHLVRSMQAARAAAAAAATTAAVVPGTGAANAGLSESALLLLDPRQRRALALAKYRKKRKVGLF